MTRENIAATVAHWIACEPDPFVAKQIADLSESEQRELFSGRLHFGTAGIRGTIGPGPNQMNRVMVRWVSTGLAHYVLEHGVDSQSSGVVIGFDGRHGSRAFAEDTARVMAGAGFRVYLYSDVVPTPELSHAVVELGCAAGVMVTASHNPPKDNGYKVYWANGAQIIPPHDVGISACIDAIEPPISIPELASVSSQILSVPASTRARYLSRVSALRCHPTRPLRIVYTAMHGVGSELIGLAFAQAGYDDLHYVSAQKDPDPDFPTVAFPNPEEPGAMDLAMAAGTEVSADLIIANDPDADRLCVVIPGPDGEWRALSGNEVGVLLAEDLLTWGEQFKDAPRMVATTIVSSMLLAKIADAHGVEYVECLTGFKWIANRAIPFDAAGGHFVMGYEEALGYSVGSVVRDKDGVSAALLFADLAAWCKSEGRSVWQHLTALYRKYGVYVSAQKSVVLPGNAGKKQIEAMMSTLRQTGLSSVAGQKVVRHNDLLSGVSTDVLTGKTSAIDLPSSNVLAFYLADGSRILARPSGTEPKIKFYFEVIQSLGEDESLDEAKALGFARIQVQMAEVLRAAGL